MWTRRDFLTLAGAGFAAGLTPARAEALARTETVFASAGKAPDGSFVALWLGERGEVLFSAPLPQRGHGLTVSPRGDMIAVFARRPGVFAAIFDAGGQPVGAAAAPTGRHFYGHGVFAPDGRLLYATENDFENARGAIGIYDATDRFRRIGEFDSFGVGPHDLRLGPSGRHLIVANGGLETHPDYGRNPLNLASMAPNIAFIDRDAGTLIGRHTLPPGLSKLSLRHLAGGPGRDLWVGAQYMGSASRAMPLLARLGPDSGLRFAPIPEAVSMRLNNYVGGMASSPDGTRVVVTSPTGDMAVLYDSVSDKAGLIGLENVCGAAFSGAVPVLSSGSGGFRAADGTVRHSADLFDNHLALVGCG